MVTFANFIVLSGLLAGIASPSAVVLDSDNNNAVSEQANNWTKHSISVSQSQIDAVLERDKFVVLEDGEITVTAFSSTPDQTDDMPFVMASGKYVYDGAIATNFLPFGVKIRFPEIYGNKIFIVEDRMNKKHSKRIDIWMKTRDEAKNFGVKKLKYEIVKEIDEKSIVAVK